MLVFCVSADCVNRGIPPSMYPKSFIYVKSVRKYKIIIAKYNEIDYFSSPKDRKIVNKAINELNERDKLIITLRFGLSNGKEKTQKEVADMLGISQSYISRLEKRIIAKLKHDIGNII